MRRALRPGVVIKVQAARFFWPTVSLVSGLSSEAALNHDENSLRALWCRDTPRTGLCARRRTVVLSGGLRPPGRVPVLSPKTGDSLAQVVYNSLITPSHASFVLPVVSVAWRG